MFGLGLATKIYVAVEAVDMRKGFTRVVGPVSPIRLELTASSNGKSSDAFTVYVQ